jgi:hypothetical protein
MPVKPRPSKSAHAPFVPQNKADTRITKQHYLLEKMQLSY